jgi:hypothetical protein
MRNVPAMLLWLLCVLGSSSCATQAPPPAKVPVLVAPAKLPPAPADVMVPREANFLQRLLNFSSTSPAKPTE